MKQDIHKKYEVTYWYTDGGFGTIKSFDDYEEAKTYLSKLDVSKMSTVRMQEAIELYIKGEHINLNESE